MIKEVLDDVKNDMTKAVDSMKHGLTKIRTGRASISLLDGLMADYYGTATPINQLATLSTPEPRLIAVQPWDKGAFQPIEKAILKSELGLTPQNDGKIIRIPIPPLNEERRRDLVKLVKKTGEEFKVEIRNYRRDGNALLKEMEKEKEISKDDLAKGQEEIQTLTDDYIKKIDVLMMEKEREIMEI